MRKHQFTPWEAVCDARSVYIPYKSELMELRDRGFGDLKGNKLLLTPYESFYLFEKQKIIVHSKRTKDAAYSARYGTEVLDRQASNLDKVSGISRSTRPWIYCARIESRCLISTYTERGR